jgi:hypothetical protein
MQLHVNLGQARHYKRISLDCENPAGGFAIGLRLVCLTLPYRESLGHTYCASTMLSDGKARLNTQCH